MSDNTNALILAALDSLRAGQANLEGGLANLRVELTGRLDRLQADIMARIDRLQDTLTGEQEANVVNFGAAERAERIAKGAQGEVRAIGDQVNAMIRQIQRLQSEVRQLKGES